jgi:hypothetical protein
MQSGNTMTGNGTDAIQVVSDTVSSNGTWANNGVPITTLGTVNVNASISVQAGTIMEFQGDLNLDIGSGGQFVVGQGSVLKFAAGVGLNVGSSNYASLVADAFGGTAVSFTSNASTPAPGDWKGISFNSYSQSNSLLDNAIVEYAGNTTGAGVTYTSTSAPYIRNSAIRYNSGLGVKFNANTSPAQFSGNTITGNTGYPVEIFAQFLRTLPAGNAYTGNGIDAIKVMGGNVTTTGTWAYSGVPMEIQSDVFINIGSGGSITIAPGSMLKFQSGAGLTVGDSTYASLIADGSASLIKFMSASSTPAPGDWDGITFSSYTQSATNLDTVSVTYGGANGKGNVYMNGSGTNVSLTNSNIENSSAYGVYVTTGATFSPGDEATCSFSGNASGTVFRE